MEQIKNVIVDYLKANSFMDKDTNWKIMILLLRTVS